MELLQRSGDRGYPEEYLVSRIRGRGSRRISDWDGLVFSHDPVGYLRTTEHRDNVEEHSGEGAWIFLARELKWLHTQMNGGLKEVFDPFFLYIEIETLIRCFRYRYAKNEGPELEGILRYSLLSNRIRQIILMNEDLPVLIAELEKREVLASAGMSGLPELFEEYGLQGLEQGLRRAFLETIRDMSLDPELRDFFSYTIDSWNLKAVAACLKWGVRTEPHLISGGTAALSRIRKIFHDSDMPECARLVSGLTGLMVKEAVPSVIDNVLHKGMAKRLRTAKRRGADRGLILNYLWECYMEARDLSTVLYGRGVDRDRLREELVH